jgi:glycerol-3-phosphate dehydrogenase (NAD(P)+)
MTSSVERTITVLGDGGWGTALAILLHHRGHQVALWSAFPDYAAVLKAKRENVKFLPGVCLPPGLEVTADMAVAAGAELLVAAVPTPYLRSVLQKLARSYAFGTPIVNVAKGIEVGTRLRGSEVVRDVLDSRGPVAVLSGPSHAQEVAHGLPTTVVVSSADPALAKMVQQTFMGDRFRVYTNPDVIGVELGGALKNVIAIAAGICDGLGFGSNSKAALITRGLAEIARLGVAMGAKRETFAGLTGLGDLFTTCVSPLGRNRYVGEQIGKGRKLRDVLATMEQVAEGVLTTKAVCALADQHHVDMPITRQIHQVLFEDKNALEAVAELMVRAPKSEVEELQ